MSKRLLIYGLSFAQINRATNTLGVNILFVIIEARFRKRTRALKNAA
ncbi:hypothetical protein EDC90_103625 [Martelella mediterranea]|uniref:Uncharacterized protein n=1 Tax=Martelella mediterranea TaxID=293089 RepID=A0A4R3NPX1_9HYPH|nr:hypothetical protein EDC90_103625 [Martelella mediterranea]